MNSDISVGEGETLEDFVQRMRDNLPGRLLEQWSDFWELMDFEEEREYFKKHLPEIDPGIKSEDPMMDALLITNVMLKYHHIAMNQGACINIEQMKDYLCFREIVFDENFAESLPETLAKTDFSSNVCKQLMIGQHLFDKHFSGLSDILTSMVPYFIPEDGEDISETFSPSTSSDVIIPNKLAELYEEKMLIAFQQSALRMDAIFFDFKNLLMNDYTSQSISSLLDSGRLDGDAITNSRKMRGLSSLFFKEEAYAKLFAHKHLYAVRKGAERRKKAVRLLSFALYSADMFHCTSSSGRLNLLFNAFKTQEFWDYLNRDDLESYIKDIKDGRDFGTKIMPVIDSIYSKLGEEAGEEAALAYLTMFTGESNLKRSPDNLTRYTGRFTDLWIRAHRDGWGEVLRDNLDTIATKAS
jgi:hypothetical protein